MYGQVRIDVLEVRQIEIDQPSDDPGDRLHAFAHAWASDSATEVTIEVAQDIVRLILDEEARPAALAQLGRCGSSTAGDTVLVGHVVRRSLGDTTSTTMPLGMA